MKEVAVSGKMQRFAYVYGGQSPSQFVGDTSRDVDWISCCDIRVASIDDCALGLCKTKNGPNHTSSNLCTSITPPPDASESVVDQCTSKPPWRIRASEPPASFLHCDDVKFRELVSKEASASLAGHWTLPACSTRQW